MPVNSELQGGDSRILDAAWSISLAKMSTLEPKWKFLKANKAKFKHIERHLTSSSALHIPMHSCMLPLICIHMTHALMHAQSIYYIGRATNSLLPEVTNWESAHYDDSDANAWYDECFPVDFAWKVSRSCYRVTFSELFKSLIFLSPLDLRHFWLFSQKDPRGLNCIF